MDKEFIAILDCIDAPLFILERSEDDEPIYIALNKKVRDSANLEHSAVIGKTAKEIYKNRFGQLAYNNHCECLRSGKKMQYDLSIQLKNKDNHVRTTLIPMLDEQGKTCRIIGTTHFINAEYLIREAHEKTLTLHNADIEQLISLSAHDLRSPMRNIKQLTEMLLQDFQDLGDGKLEIIKLLEKVSNSTFSLIGNILNYAQASSAVESIEDFNLAPLCHEIFSMLDPQDLHEMQVNDICISGDKIATQVITRNLIDNSIKHNKGNALNIQISASQLDDHNFQISVSDNGKGMADPSTLFTTSKLTKIDSGFGSQGIVRLLKARGGDITASTKEGDDGLVVNFYLPGRAYQL